MAQDRRIAFVTGARRGIGRAIALALAGRGYDVVINDIARDDAAEATLAALREAGARSTFVAGDISAESGHAALVQSAWDAFGRLDALVNNAGVSVAKRGDMLEEDIADIDRVMRINLRGPWLLTAELARRWVAEPQREGRAIAFITSANAFLASPDRASYVVSKSALSMVVKLFALRLAEHGIPVHEIRPGVIATDMTAVAKERYDKRIAEGLSPIARWGQPEDIGRAVAALIAGDIPFTTGDAFHIDGGLHLQRL